MRLWIIGKDGMLAGAFKRICKEKGIDHFATSRKEVDLTEPENVRAQFETMEFSHVINCSGYTQVDQAEEAEEKARALNVDAVETLAKLCKEFGKNLVHFSTDYVFDGETETPYGEEAGCNPLSVYGKTKREGEERLHAIYPEACLIRTSWLFGKEGNHFVKSMVGLMQKEENLEVVSDQKGRPTFADDLVRVALNLKNESGIFHYANSGEASWHEWADEILKRLNEKKLPIKCAKISPICLSERGGKAERPKSSVLGTKKVEELEGSAPRSWKEGLDEVIESLI